MNVAKMIPSTLAVNLVYSLALAPHLRTIARKLIRQYAYRFLVEQNKWGDPEEVQHDKVTVIDCILYAVERGLSQGCIGPRARHKILEVLLGNNFLIPNEAFQRFTEQYKMSPPGFVTISPTARCNLKCPGCYAGSDTTQKMTLPLAILERILKDAEELWGVHFIVISGGEPILYKDEGKTILDVFEEHSNQYFLVYTNGTLISPEIADRLGELGNATLAVSVEGLEKETDERRGTGTFDRILRGLENLRRAGVPFGISATAMRHNAERILDEDFIDFFFFQQGALYEWIFQYMPIGRVFSLDMMVTPEQRLRMYEKTWTLIREKRLFIADFWNTGTASDGCIAAGGGYGGGYFYIDWNGSVAPCVFNPFSVDNIKDVYAKGGDLNTALFSQLFKDIRQWQRKYFHDQPKDQRGNLIAPCPIRDHHLEMRAIIDQDGARPIDHNAEIALKDAAYSQGLAAYGQQFDRMTQKIWDKHYLEPERKKLN